MGEGGASQVATGGRQGEQPAFVSPEWAHEDENAVGLDLISRVEAPERRRAAPVVPPAIPSAIAVTAAEHRTRHVGATPRAVADDLAVDGPAAQLVGVDGARLAEAAQLGVPARRLGWVERAPCRSLIGGRVLEVRRQWRQWRQWRQRRQRSRAFDDQSMAPASA